MNVVPTGAQQRLRKHRPKPAARADRVGRLCCAHLPSTERGLARQPTVPSGAPLVLPYL